MAYTYTIASNKQTQQPSLADQSVRCILAGRAYVKALDATAATNKAPQIGKIGNGNDPSFTSLGWVDLGAIAKSKVMMEYSKEYTEVRAGLDGVYKCSYVTSKSCQWTFALENYDHAVMAAITGQNFVSTALVSSATGYKFWVGKEDTVSKQLLVVGTNKIDSKEHQYWCPSVDMRFAWADDGDAITIQITALLRSYAFNATNVGTTSIDSSTGDTTVSTDTESFYQVTIWQ